jgi:hypothetical protein
MIDRIGMADGDLTVADRTVESGVRLGTRPDVN